jgi:hypothetical protein
VLLTPSPCDKLSGQKCFTPELVPDVLSAVVVVLPGDELPELAPALLLAVPSNRIAKVLRRAVGLPPPDVVPDVVRAVVAALPADELPELARAMLSLSPALLPRSLSFPK